MTMKEKIVKMAASLRVDGRLDVVKLARQLDLKVRLITDLMDIFNNSAFIKKDNGDFSIYVNGAQSKQRQRFSIAHEIAHFCLHKDELMEKGALHRGDVESLAPEKEKEADSFAANILMPKDDIKTFLKSAGIEGGGKIDKEIIKTLCRRYDVSFYSVIVRLRDIGYFVPFITTYED